MECPVIYEPLRTLLYGPDYRAIRRADRQTIGGIEFLVAQPDDAPVPPKHKSGRWVTWPT